MPKPPARPAGKPTPKPPKPRRDRRPRVSAADRAAERAAVGKCCGDYGGRVFETGDPCRRDPGWGTPLRAGPCVDHGAAAAEKLAAAKSAYLAAFAGGDVSLQKAAKDVEASVPTVWRWRQADPEFDQAVRDAQVRVDQIRVALVEDSLFARLVSGKASGTELVFYLQNRAPDRWQDHRRGGFVTPQDPEAPVVSESGHATHAPSWEVGGQVLQW